jgi:histidinol phosphatase-like PHP family hydrolase
MHSTVSDGDLIPSEIARRAEALDHRGIAITDHVDKSSIESTISGLIEAARDINSFWDIRLLVGVELTHVPIQTVDELARKAKILGANIVLVHGETLAEPVLPGTNAAAAQSRYVDILAHPGRISLEDARCAADSGKYAEITAKETHGQTNDHVAHIAAEAGLKTIVNTDLHRPADFVTQEKAFEIAEAAGMDRKSALATVVEYPGEILADASLYFRR